MRRWLDDMGYGAMLAVIAVTLAFLVAPIVVSIMMSFDGRAFLGKFPPPDYSFRWYESFFSDSYYLAGLRTSLVLAVIAMGTVVALFHASAFSYFWMTETGFSTRRTCKLR